MSLRRVGCYPIRFYCCSSLFWFYHHHHPSRLLLVGLLLRFGMDFLWLVRLFRCSRSSLSMVYFAIDFSAAVDDVVVEHIGADGDDVAGCTDC